MRITKWRGVLAAGTAATVLAAPLAFAAPLTRPLTIPRTPAMGVERQCFAPVTRIDPQADSSGHPTNPAWIQRDELNQYCAELRIRDQVTNPAFIRANGDTANSLYVQQAQEQLADGPGHIHGGVTTLVPGSQAADPFRSVDAWQRATGGRSVRVTFKALDGAQLHGHVWLPPKHAAKPRHGYPGVIITDGSVQGFENLYYWAAEGLAQYGYEVMTFDVQGQGDSDLLPADCTPSSCPGVPYQQSYNFYQGTEDALNFFLGAHNPARGVLDAQHVGIAGHSLGASAVSWVGQCDSRVKTIVAWDDLAPVTTKQCAANVTVPKAYRATRLHTPALATTNDYEFNVQPASRVPNPHGDSNAGGIDGDAGYLSLTKAGVDSEIVSFRNGTHLTYTYIPYVLPSNELSERFAFYYTLAWFDRYLRGGADPYTSQSAYQRLTNLGAYDASADTNRLGKISIGAGLFDPSAAATDPTNDGAGNVPYTIRGIPILNSLSFYYYSAFRLTDPRTHRVRSCSDMLAHCPTVAPPTP